jgi:surface antigen
MSLNKLIKLGLIGAMSLPLMACSNVNASKQDQGLVGGAVAGGVLGSAIGGRGKGGVIGGVLGAVAGGIVGHEIGKSMDERDRQLAQQAEYRAFNSPPQSYERYAWDNPNNGRRGEIVPGPMHRRGQEDCREYTHTIYIDGRREAMRGVACRNYDGTWRNVG